MIKIVYDLSGFDSLNHKFVDCSDDPMFDIEYTKCVICNFRVWVGEKEFWYFVNCSWKKLDLTCEEYQIKRLLE